MQSLVSIEMSKQLPAARVILTARLDCVQKAKKVNRPRPKGAPSNIVLNSETQRFIL